MGGYRNSQINLRSAMLRGQPGTALILRDNPMTNVDRHGDEYPPSRPGPKTLLAALLVILAGLAVAFWPQVMGAIGIHVAPPGSGG
jgi:hypothetical protein